MEFAYAEEIITWMYEDEYSMYSFSGSKEELNELMNGDYYSALDQGRLIGYICSGQSARVPGGFTIGLYDEQEYMDIGLGLKPSLTGKGLGFDFLKQSIKFLNNKLNTTKFRLVVAEFNERAIKVYERAGFIRFQEFYSKDIKFLSLKVD